LFSRPACHVERSETSLEIPMETSPENDQRFFASLRMTLQDSLISLAIQRPLRT
jgi:hypothetical protein